MDIKLSDAIDVTVCYLLGKERFGKYDKESVERLQEIQNLDDSTRKTLFSIIDTFVRDAKARVVNKQKSPDLLGLILILL